MDKIKIGRLGIMTGICLLTGYLLSSPARAFSTGAKAVCTHPSHRNRWFGPCRSNGGAGEDADKHSVAHAGHNGGFISTAPCETGPNKETVRQEKIQKEKIARNREKKAPVEHAKVTPERSNTVTMKKKDPEASAAKRKKKKSQTSTTDNTASRE
jgi:hypothetical protein